MNVLSLFIIPKTLAPPTGSVHLQTAKFAMSLRHHITCCFTWHPSACMLPENHNQLYKEKSLHCHACNIHPAHADPSTDRHTGTHWAATAYSHPSYCLALALRSIMCCSSLLQLLLWALGTAEEDSSSARQVCCNPCSSCRLTRSFLPSRSAQIDKESLPWSEITGIGSSMCAGNMNRYSTVGIQS